MPARAGSAADRLAELESIRGDFGGDAGERKSVLLRTLAKKPGRGAARLLRLHEAALFLRAWPDSAAVRDAAEAILASTGRCVEALPARERDRIDESGLAGTAVYCAFALALGRWLAAGYSPGHLYLHGDGGDGGELGPRLDEALQALVLPAEVEALADGYLSASDWLARPAGVASGAGRALFDADPALARLIELFDSLPLEPARRDALWAALALPLRWELGEGRGSRTRARAPASETVFVTAPPPPPPLPARRHVRPAHGPRLVRLDPSAAWEWIDLARAATAVRLREVHPFLHAWEADVAVADLGGGLRIALHGVEPHARHALRSFYGYLLVQNDVPVGYGDAVLLFEWAELSFHVFDTFRGAGSRRLFAGLVETLRAHAGVRYLALNRYQIGWHNHDGIASGAFWFYEKLGFRPTGARELELWRSERGAREQDPAHRSSEAVLERLARGHMALALGGAVSMRRYRDFHPMTLALAVSRRVERVYGGDRQAAAHAATTRVVELLGGLWRDAPLGVLGRMAPFLDLVPDLESWKRTERGALAAILRAKTHEPELACLALTRKHRRLQAALLAAAAAERFAARKDDAGS